MTTVEILLLIFGAIIFIASFIVPEAKGGTEAVDKQLTKEQIREILKEEMKHVQDQVTDVIDETVNSSVEKSERALERLTNDKIQAISEYSGTVLTDIHKNHEETMFLYDMLNDKHENLKETASEVTQAVKQASNTVSQAVRRADETVSEVNQTSRQMEKLLDEMHSAVGAKYEEDGSGQVVISGIERIAYMQGVKPQPPKKENTKAEPEHTQMPETEPDVEDVEQGFTEVDLTEYAASAGDKPEADTGEDTDAAGHPQEESGEIKQSGNNKEQILAMYAQGESTVVIAKTLGLGVGEVQLIIDLYKGM